MKKCLTALAVLIALAFSGCSPEPGTDPTGDTAPETTSVPVKTVYVHSSITQTYGETTTRTDYLYDEQERLTQVVISTNDTETLRYQVTCDRNGNPIRWDTTMEGKASSIEYTYDDWGNTLGTYAYTDGVLMSATEYTWGNGLRVSVTAGAPTQNYERRTEYTYDENGVLFRQDLYINGELSTYTVCASDPEGKLTESRSYDLDGELLSIITYTYDGTNETRVTTDAHGDLLQTQELSYDEAGNLLQSGVYDQNGELLARETHIWLPIQTDPDCPRASI